MFVQLVTIGNFSKTAEFLKIAPSTLSRKIQELEAYFNKILITRDTRNFSLTADGDIIYQTFKNLPNQLINAKQRLSPDIKANISTLNIVLPVTHALEFITPYIPYFNKVHPEIKLNIFYMPAGSRPNKATVDVAVTLRPSISGKFDQKFLRSEFIQFYCTTNYATKYGLPLAIDELQNHSVIGGIDHLGNILDHPIFTNKYTGETFIYDGNKNIIKISDVVHALKVGLNGEHIFPCWSYLCDGLVTKGELIQVCPEYYALKTDFLLLTRKNSSREIQLFVDFIYRCMNKMIRIDNDLTNISE